VTPRQRPKACQLNPVNQSFTIGLPPSPSPRNILSSPIDTKNFKAPSKTPENFNAQFEVHFNNIETPTASTTPLALNATMVQQPQAIEKFDSLFKTNLYPDPFGENDELVEIQTNYADNHQTRGQQLFETIESQQPVTAKVNQHRRYLSDTSGFKRFYKFTGYEKNVLNSKFCS
jgi:AP2-associated kinase